MQDGEREEDRGGGALIARLPFVVGGKRPLPRHFTTSGESTRVFAPELLPLLDSPKT